MQFSTLLVLAGVQLIQLSQAQLRPGDWIQPLNCNPYAFKPNNSTNIAGMQNTNFTFAQLVESQGRNVTNDTVLRQYVRDNCNEFREYPPLPPGVSLYNQTTLNEHCKRYPGMYNGSREHDDRIDRQCRMDQCMAMHRRPMSITTAFPVLGKSLGTYYVDYFTHRQLVTSDHWDHTQSSQIRYPLTQTVLIKTMTTQALGTVSSTITRGPSKSSVRTYPGVVTSTYGTLVTALAQAPPPWDQVKLNLLDEQQYQRAPQCWDHDTCFEHCMLSSAHVHNTSREVKPKRNIFRNKSIWAILAGVAGGLLLLSLLCCCFARRRRNRNKRRDPPSAISMVTSTASPSTVGSEAAAVPAAAVVAEKGTIGRQTEEGRGRVHFPEDETKVVTTGAPGAEKVVTAPVERVGVAPAAVVEKPAVEHVEPVPVHDGTDNGPTTGSDRPDVGSLRGRKRNRLGF